MELELVLQSSMRWSAETREAVLKLLDASAVDADQRTHTARCHGNFYSGMLAMAESLAFRSLAQAVRERAPVSISI